MKTAHTDASHNDARANHAVASARSTALPVALGFLPLLFCDRGSRLARSGRCHCRSARCRRSLPGAAMEGRAVDRCSHRCRSCGSCQYAGIVWDRFARLCAARVPRRHRRRGARCRSRRRGDGPCVDIDTSRAGSGHRGCRQRGRTAVHQAIGGIGTRRRRRRRRRRDAEPVGPGIGMGDGATQRALAVTRLNSIGLDRLVGERSDGRLLRAKRKTPIEGHVEQSP